MVAAVVLGLVTSYLVWTYVSQASQGSKPVQTAPVLVAVESVPPRTVLTPAMLRVQQIPVEARVPGALSDPRDAVGKVVRTELATGEQVLGTKLFLQRQESGLAFMIPDGMRAVSVNFTELIGSGGLIIPGDHVDVMGVFQASSTKSYPLAGPSLPDSNGDTVSLASLVLQDVQVLAVAQVLEGQDTRDTATRVASSVSLGGSTGSAAAAPATRSQPVAQPQAKTATLAVTTEDALRLVLAEETGRIRLALRPSPDATGPTPGTAQPLALAARP
jgi:pilus assembly protein CpaB